MPDLAEIQRAIIVVFDCPSLSLSHFLHISHFNRVDLCDCMKTRVYLWIIQCALLPAARNGAHLLTGRN